MLETSDKPSRIRGWLLLLCVLLIVWEPLTLAYVASGRVAAALRFGAGWLTTLLLMLRIAVTGLGMVAGVALWQLQPNAIALVNGFLMASTVNAALTLTIPLSADRPPFVERLPLFVLIASYNLGWHLYLRRSRQVAESFGRP